MQKENENSNIETELSENSPQETIYVFCNVLVGLSLHSFSPELRL